MFKCTVFRLTFLVLLVLFFQPSNKILAQSACSASIISTSVSGNCSAIFPCISSTDDNAYVTYTISYQDCPDGVVIDTSTNPFDGSGNTPNNTWQGATSFSGGSGNNVTSSWNFCNGGGDVCYGFESGQALYWRVRNSTNNSEIATSQESYTVNTPPPLIEASTNYVEVNEGGEPQTADIRLTKAPQSAVTISLSLAYNHQGANTINLNHSSFIFTPQNWDSPQNLTITSSLNQRMTHYINGSINLTSSSSDSDFDNYPINGISFSINEGDNLQPSESWPPFLTSLTDNISYPTDVAVGPDGSIYETDGSTWKVNKYNASGVWLKQWSVDNQYPNQITVSSSGIVYVVANYSIYRYDSDGNQIGVTWTGASGNNPLENLNSPYYGITVDKDNNLYVCDSNERRVLKYSSTGEYLISFTDNDLNSPADVAVDSQDNVYITDLSSDKIFKFSPNGSRLTWWGEYGSQNGQFGGPYGITTDSHDDVYILDKNNFRVQKFDNEGNFLTIWGSEGPEDNQFEWPSAIVSNTKGNLFIADSGNYRIQVYGPAIDLPVTPTPEVTPTVGDDPTPTVTPTNRPVINDNGSLKQVSNDSGPPRCGDQAPDSAPDLFQINATATSAKLLFTPIANTSTFYISYSTKSSAEEHGLEVKLAREGVQNYTVNFLKPSTTYYFKVRGQSGCMPGDWSGVIKITTRPKGVIKTISFFKNSIPKKASFEPIGIKINKIAKPTAVPTQTTIIPSDTLKNKVPTPLPTKGPAATKKCILWWCW